MRRAGRLIGLATVLGLGPVMAMADTSRDVAIGGLAGSWIVPASAATYPAVLIIAGSGPTDRDGNSPQGLRTDAYKQLATALAAAGIASLRYDKRGVGASRAAAGAEAGLTIESFARDAADLAAWVQIQPGVASLHVAGHSEGGLLALLLAIEAKPGSLILLAAPGRPLGAILREQLKRQPLPDDLQSEGERAIASLEAGGDPGAVTSPLDQLFRQSVRPFLRSIFKVDPAAHLAARSEPVLVIGGGKDIQVRRADFDVLATARPGLTTTHWEAEMTHVLKAARADDPAQVKAYTDATEPLMPGLAKRIAAWIKAH